MIWTRVPAGVYSARNVGGNSAPVKSFTETIKSPTVSDPAQAA